MKIILLYIISIITVENELKHVMMTMLQKFLATSWNVTCNYFNGPITLVFPYF